MKTLFSRINVSKQGEDELILRISPTLSYIFMLGFIVLALLLFLFNVTTTCSTKLACEKLSTQSNNISCDLSSVNLLGVVTKQAQLFSNVPQAVIIKENNEEINQTEYQAILKTDVQEIILARNSINYHYNEWQENVIKINKFVDDYSIKTLIVEDKNGDIVFSGFIINLFLLFVIVIIWIAKTCVTCTISHKSKMIVIEQKKLFSKKIDNYSLKDIKKAFLETSDGIEKTTNRIAFELNTGETIPVVPYYDSFLGKKEAILHINKFIK